MPRGLVAGLSSLLAAACSSSSTQPQLAPCTATSAGSVSQVYAALTALDPLQTSGCAVFPDNATGAPIEYLLVPQSASTRVNDSSTFLLHGTAVVAAAAPRAFVRAAAEPGAQQRFDLALRRAERDLVTGPGRQLRPDLAPSAPVQALAPGDVRTFNVCGDTLCLTHPTVTATAKTVGQHVAIFVDNTAADTLATMDLNSLAAEFDTLLYPADTAAFGHESDRDGNGRVIVLMTGAVNTLTPKSSCSRGSIVGYFYGGDLLTGFKGGNNAEIFFSVVPDPGAVLSCAHSVNDVKNAVPATFIHEFQHMINWGHHVSPSGIGASEQLWLNEGLSHYAEELGARLFLPGDSATFCYFVFGDLYNSGQYFLDPEASFLVDDAGIGGLASRGAYWLFVRFLVDQFAADQSVAQANVVTRALDITTLTGATNVSHATNTPFATIVQRWGLANYLSDRPGFPTPATWQYVTWRFRTDYPAVHASCLAKIGTVKVPAAFPLTPDSAAGDTLDLSGVLRAGSGRYFLAQQSTGAGAFTLLFSDGGGRALHASLAPWLNVIRIQ